MPFQSKIASAKPGGTTSFPASPVINKTSAVGKEYLKPDKLAIDRIISPNAEYLITPTEISLTLQGESQVISGLEQGDYYALVDLKDYTDSTLITITKDDIVVPDDVNLVDYNPKELTFELPWSSVSR